jgi:hypothetical protein
VNPLSVFSIRKKNEFEIKALEVFLLQAEKNSIYRKYIEQIGVIPGKVRVVSQIPFLPIEFYKTHEVITDGNKESGDRRNNSISGLRTPDSILFLSSGTTGPERSKHLVSDVSLYEKSFGSCFELFYGDPSKYAFLVLLPSYYENKNSSLIYMMMELMKRSRNKYSSFYNSKDETIIQVLKTLLKGKQKVILFGVSFALLDLPPIALGAGVTVIETGGMKGKREEITRDELHKILCKKFGVKKIHSEYGMTELLSQVWSKGNGIFNCPPWMKVQARDAGDPLSMLPYGKAGALNIIDLANIHSCSFIATQDLGKVHRNGSFEVLGRLDNSDVRGCNLLTV